MCGIVGYVGSPGSAPALGVVLDGLRRLEYRGYDSAGIAIVDENGDLITARKAGPLGNLEKALAQSGPLGGLAGVGHTRWATHGAPTDRNAHPHLDCTGDLAVIHNGIIENHLALRTELEAAGHEMASDTDTEVVAHLLEAEWSRAGNDLVEAMRLVAGRLEGAFTLLALHRGQPDLIVGARRNSPLVVGVGEGAMFLGSDVAAFISSTRNAVELGQDQIVAITPTGYTISDFAGQPAEGRPFHVDWDLSAAEKDGHAFFMQKEIEEQPAAVRDTLRGRLTSDGHIVLDEERIVADDLRDIDKVFVVACGTAYHAGLVAKYAIEHWSRIPVEVELSSEFRYRDPVLDRSTLVVAISQSGETADTLEAIRHAKAQKARVLAISNTNGAQIPRESDAVLYTRAGPEIGVASTKCFLAQLTATSLLALAIARVRGTKDGDEVAREYAALERMPGLVAETLSRMDPMRALAREISGSRIVLFLGRHVGYPVALEGALKLKELAYVHAEGYPAGELKHGPIALIEEGVPVVVVMPSPRSRAVLHAKVLSNIAEVTARGARTIVVAEDGDDAVTAYASDVIRVPRAPTLYSPIVTTIPMQVLAAEFALARGLDIDKPRNLAKSVTVE
ncbi:MAG TPA: glutamine--fructose-6-phosphate transaminase (isomerizing) [Solirubrobacteraceae bacterium]|nr:glutamine--fructose-6-phosphate transaminase (isomerizing) [Solirubrobacteraceae bacterium]